MPGLTRKTLRSATAARLVAAAVAPANAVFASRAQALPTDHAQPVILVYTGSEESERASIGVPEFARTTEIAIEAVTYGTADDDLEDALDDLGDAIEEALLTSPAYLAQFDRVEKVSRETDIDMDNDRRRGAVRIALSVRYDVRFEPVNEESDFTSAEVTIRPYDEATGEPAPATDPVAVGVIELEGP